MKQTWAIFLSPPLERSEAARLMTRIRKEHPRTRFLPASSDPNAGVLTPRQKAVLREIATGKGTKEIGRSLSISPKTVETHRANLMDRLGIHHIPGLLRYALQTGILPTTWLQ